MALKFRLRGLAETFIEEITCPECGTVGNDDQSFTTEHTKVTFEGIVVIVECRSCGEIFVPSSQRLGVLDSRALKAAVERDAGESGEPMHSGVQAVRLTAEKLNASRRGDLH
jgi:uncharacterized Zn finger protein